MRERHMMIYPLSMVSLVAFLYFMMISTIDF